MIKIDGRTFDVVVGVVSRKIDFYYKYANRTEDGILHKEEIGVYVNFGMECWNVRKNSEYTALIKKLKEIPNDHMVTVYDDDGEVEQNAYFSSISDRIVPAAPGSDIKPKYTNLKFNVLAIVPEGAVKA